MATYHWLPENATPSQAGVPAPLGYGRPVHRAEALVGVASLALSMIEIMLIAYAIMMANGGPMRAGIHVSLGTLRGWDVPSYWGGWGDWTFYFWGLVPFILPPVALALGIFSLRRRDRRRGLGIAGLVLSGLLCMAIAVQVWLW